MPVLELCGAAGVEVGGAAGAVDAEHAEHVRDAAREHAAGAGVEDAPGVADVVDGVVDAVHVAGAGQLDWAVEHSW